MIKKKSVQELLDRTKEAAAWIHKNSDKGETKDMLRRLWSAVRSIEGEFGEDRAGFALLVEVPKRGRRITITVEEPNRYLSRVGWESAGVDAEVTYSREVKSITAARERLRQSCPNEHFSATGMEWSQTPPKALMKAIDTLI
jgi:hypothetical protein